MTHGPSRSLIFRGMEWNRALLPIYYAGILEQSMGARNQIGTKDTGTKDTISRFGRRRLLIFEVFLGLHRKREGEEGVLDSVLAGS
jgi:hypothetical protein